MNKENKRLFQTLDEMNVADGENNTGNVGICNFLVSANKTKQGGHVTMGVPESVVLDLVLNPKKKMCLLLVIEKSEYEKVSTPVPSPTVEDKGSPVVHTTEIKEGDGNLKPGN